MQYKKKKKKKKDSKDNKNKKKILLMLININYLIKELRTAILFSIFRNFVISFCYCSLL